jgi:hypothetical protein
MSFLQGKHTHATTSIFIPWDVSDTSRNTSSQIKSWDLKAIISASVGWFVHLMTIFRFRIYLVSHGMSYNMYNKLENESDGSGGGAFKTI